jgi:serine/threonine-protein kinase SRPK3
MRVLFKTIFAARRRPPSPPRPVVARSGFKTIDSAVKFEEERLPHYDKALFYPVRIGEIFEDRYQVLSKLGFGANATVWFCRDLT